jgi:nicotinamide-nucleotide amidase
MEGVIAYSNNAKIRTLGVDSALIEKYGAVSAEVAEAMADGVRRHSDTDFGLSVTGIAGPGGGTVDKPVGLVYIALSDDAHTEHRKLMLPGDRHLIRWRSSQAALDLLRRRLI